MALAGGGDRGGAAAVALLGLHWVWAADALACTARSRPGAEARGGSGVCWRWWQGRGSSARFAQLALLAAEGEVGGGAARCLACAHWHWRGVGGCVLVRACATMSGHWSTINMRWKGGRGETIVMGLGGGVIPIVVKI